jgi:hypothetical protein
MLESYILCRGRSSVLSPVAQREQEDAWHSCYVQTNSSGSGSSNMHLHMFCTGPHLCKPQVRPALHGSAPRNGTETWPRDTAQSARSAECFNGEGSKVSTQIVRYGCCLMLQRPTGAVWSDSCHSRHIHSTPCNTDMSRHTNNAVACTECAINSQNSSLLQLEHQQHRIVIQHVMSTI